MKMYMVHDLIRGGWSAFWKTRSWDGSQIIFLQSQIHTSYLSILVHRRIIEVYKKYTKKLSELATK